MAIISYLIPDATKIKIVSTYADLPLASSSANQFYWVENSTGTSWLPGSLGGTYRQKGLYYSNGVDWNFTPVPYQATQAEVDAGLNTDKFVTAETLFGYYRWITSETTVNTGIIYGGELSINADPTKLDISAGKGFIVNHSASPPVVNIVEWNAFVGIPINNLTTSFATDIAINSSGNIVQQNSFTNAELRSLILLGGVDHSNLTSILNTFEIQVPSNGVGSSLKELSKAIGDINISGNVFSPNGANLKLNKSAGTAFKFGANNTANLNDPHTITQAVLSPVNFSHVFNDGAGNGVFQPLTTDINPGNFDNGTGILASVTGNSYTIQRILLFPNANTVFVQYGTQVFNTLAAAISGLSTQNYPALNGIKTATVRGYLIVRANATALNNSIQAVFIEADRFGGIGARDGGGGITEWGNIIGTLTNQTDLQNALNTKANVAGQIFTGDVSAPKIDVITPAVVGMEQLQQWEVDDADGYVRLENSLVTPNVFSPALIFYQPTLDSVTVGAIQARGVDSGTLPMLLLNVRTIDNAAVTTRPIFRISNFTSNVLEISASGLVGINTASPTERLDVNGSIRTRSSIKFNDTAKSIDGGIGAVMSINSGTNSMVFRQTAEAFMRGTTSGVGIEIASAPVIDTSAILTLTSTTKGFLPPRMTTTQRDAISSPALGLMIYNTTTNKHQGYNGSWNDLY